MRYEAYAETVYAGKVWEGGAGRKSAEQAVGKSANHQLCEEMLHQRTHVVKCGRSPRAGAPVGYGENS